MPTILAVDDDVESTNLLKKLLEDLGYQIICANDAYSAIPAFQQHKPDLVILEYTIPAGSGTEVLQRIRSLPGGAQTPVIFLSASSKFEIQMSVLESPLIRFLEKPIDSALLQETILDLLDPGAIKSKPPALKENLGEQGPPGAP